MPVDCSPSHATVDLAAYGCGVRRQICLAPCRFSRRQLGRYGPIYAAINGVPYWGPVDCQPGKLPMRPVEGVDERCEPGDVGVRSDAMRMGRHVGVNNGAAARVKALQLAGQVPRTCIAAAFKENALLQRPLHCLLKVALHVRAAQPRVDREEVRGLELGDGLSVVRRVSGDRLHAALRRREDDAPPPWCIMRSLLGRVALAGSGVKAQAGDRSHHVGVLEARRREGAEEIQRRARDGERAAQKERASHGQTAAPYAGFAYSTGTARRRKLSHGPGGYARWRRRLSGGRGSCGAGSDAVCARGVLRHSVTQSQTCQHAVPKRE